MSAYRKTFDVPVTIDGQEHVFTLRPMTFAESLEVNDAAAGEEAKSPRSYELRGTKMRQLVAPAISNVAPVVTDAEGAEVTLKELVESLYFAGPMMALALEWVSRSQPKDPT